MAPLILTLVRHGESVDNLTSLWAGHRDAPLSTHGFNQALRLGQHFKDVPITAIYTSDLKRAHTTAKNVYEANVASSEKPPFTISPILREQYFGEAEGQARFSSTALWLATNTSSPKSEPWDAGLFSSTHLPWEDHRAFRLADSAESLTEVGNRGDAVLRHFLLPHILASAPFAVGHHVVIFAHGIFLSEMMFALKRAGEDKNVRFIKSGGYTNTGWARVELSFVDPMDAIARLEAASTASSAPLASTGIPTSFSSPSEPPTRQVVHPSSSIPPTVPSTNGLISLPARLPNLPPATNHEIAIPDLKLKVIAMNQVEHLEGLVRQKGGIGSSAHDPNQRKVADFFAGAGAKST